MYDVMRDNTRLELGRGNKISFWHDIWCGELPLKLRFPNIFAIARIKDLMVCDAFCSEGQYVVCFLSNQSGKPMLPLESLSLHGRRQRNIS